MSKKVDEKIEDTTEEDAKQAITELKRLETNLQQTKEKCRGTHSKIKIKKGAYQRICLRLGQSGARTVVLAPFFCLQQLFAQNDKKSRY